MTKLTRYLLAGLAGFTGLVLFTVTTDREFINLTPSPAQFVTLETGHTYTQTFPATRSSISRVGVYLRPVGSLPASAVALTITHSGTPVATQTIPTAAIDIEGTSQVRFDLPLVVDVGDQISLTLTVPDDLTGRVRALQRLPDNTFDPTYAVFTIDGDRESVPLAYQVYYLFRPPLAFQMGGLLILAALIVVFRSHYSLPITHYSLIIPLAVVLSVLYALPALLLADFPIALMIVTTGVFFTTSLIARRQLPAAPTLLTAAIAAFAAYWPLRLANPWDVASFDFTVSASLRNIFLDPRQIPGANPPLAWEHFGSYVGITTAVLAVVGLTTQGKRYWKTALALVGSLLLSRFLPDGIILPTLLLAFFAGAGADTLNRFLGDDKLSQTLIALISLLILLDLFHVAAAPLEFGLL